VASAGTIGGKVRALTFGASLMAQKAAGVDIATKYASQLGLQTGPTDTGAASIAPPPKPYKRG
jgi:hypothetical protein